MATNATGATTHYGLSQWAAGDGVLRTDFNSDNSLIDAALNGLASGMNGLTAGMTKAQVGHYMGTGTFGSGNPTVLTFNFPPNYVLVIGLCTVLCWARGRANSTGFRSSESDGLYYPITASGNSISWYGEDQYKQSNAPNTDYYYLAIG